MKLEQLLSDQGGDPLTDKLNGRPLRAFINANLKKVGIEPVEVSTPCDVILERIYSIEDPDIQAHVLEREVSALKGDKNYTKFSMYGAALIGIIVLGVTIAGGHLSTEAIDALKQIGLAILNIISQSQAAAP